MHLISYHKSAVRSGSIQSSFDPFIIVFNISPKKSFAASTPLNSEIFPIFYSNGRSNRNSKNIHKNFNWIFFNYRLPHGFSALLSENISSNAFVPIENQSSNWYGAFALETCNELHKTNTITEFKIILFNLNNITRSVFLKWIKWFCIRPEHSFYIWLERGPDTIEFSIFTQSKQ